MAIAAVALAGSAGAREPNPERYVLVRTAPGVDAAEILEHIDRRTFRLGHAFRVLDGFTGWVSPEGLALLREIPGVVAVGEDAPIRPALGGALPLIGAGAAVDAGVSGAGVTVAVFDSGIDVDHPDFVGRIDVGGTFINQGETSTKITDLLGHGTHVAGILASAGVVSTAGVAPQARLRVYKVVNDFGGGWASDWAAALDALVADLPPDVRMVNASLETQQLFFECPCDQAVDAPVWLTLLGQAFDALAAQGVASVVSAGNAAGRGEMSAPACLSSTTAVGAVYDADYGTQPAAGTWAEAISGFGPCTDIATGPDVIACFTNISECLDVLAPGTSIESTWFTGGGGKVLNGTSQAAPFVTGAAALLAEVNPELSAAQAVALILETGAPTTLLPEAPGERPRVDIAAALDAATPVAPMPDEDTTEPPDPETPEPTEDVVEPIEDMPEPVDVAEPMPDASAADVAEPPVDTAEPMTDISDPVDVAEPMPDASAADVAEPPVDTSEPVDVAEPMPDASAADVAEPSADTAEAVDVSEPMPDASAADVVEPMTDTVEAVDVAEPMPDGPADPRDQELPEPVDMPELMVAETVMDMSDPPVVVAEPSAEPGGCTAAPAGAGLPTSLMLLLFCSQLVSCGRQPSSGFRSHAS